jgi:hypothetical protein
MVRLEYKPGATDPPEQVALLAAKAVLPLAISKTTTAAVTFTSVNPNGLFTIELLIIETSFAFRCD